MKHIKYTAIFVLIAVLTISTSALAEGVSRVVHLDVTGMTTKTCPVLLESAVHRIKGVKNVSASLEKNSATIEFDESLTSLAQIQDSIETQVGFTTRLK